MKTSRLISILFGALLCALSAGALSVFDPVNDDTDIFLANPNIPGARPNVLIILDNTANWNSYFDLEKLALKNTVGALNERYNVGFGFFPEAGSGSIDGMYLRYAIRQMTATNKALLTNELGTGIIDLLDKSSGTGDGGSNANYSLAMDEIYNYFAGIASRSGVTQTKADLGGFATYNAAARTATYKTPIIDPCQKNFLIFISNGPANDNASALASAQNYLAGITGVNPPFKIDIPAPDDGQEPNWGDEYARWMATQDCNVPISGVQNVFTYTVDIDPKTTQDGRAQTKLLQSMASYGKGRYFAVTDTASSAGIEQALNTIFSEVQAVNSVFASVALPVSVNVRGTNLNQVYIGVFRPDPAKGPRWLGNLKMYKIGQDPLTNEVYLSDASNTTPPTRAENVATGFISPLAKSFWTQQTAVPFWNHRTVDENGAGGSNDSPDGDIVEKGGAAQHIRMLHSTDQVARRLFTCLNAAGTGLCDANTTMPAFDNGNTSVTAAELGTFTTFQVAKIESSGSTATVTMSGTTPDGWSAAGWANTNEVKIEGSPIAAYNIKKPISALDTAARTFTYTLDEPQPADTGRASHATAKHGLESGDKVSITGATPAEFNVTNAEVNRIDDFVFRFPATGVAGVAGGSYTVTGKKLVSKIVGSENTATMTIAGHGYGANGSSVTLSVLDAVPTAFNVTNATATIVDANTLTYSTTSTIGGSGGATDAAVATTAINHGYVSGQIVTVKNATETSYNGNKTVTIIGPDKFSYAAAGTGLAVDQTAGMLAGIQISQITHGTGSTQDIATVTTAALHNVTSGSQVVISGTGGPPTNNSTTSRYDGTFTATRLNATQFTITNSNIGRSPTPLTIAGMLLNERAIARIAPNVTASGTIYAAKAVTISRLASVTFVTGNITAGRPIDSSDTERTKLIEWIRGRDHMNEKSNVTAPDVRPSVHGDVLHGRPAVVNYGRDGSENDITVFYGSNDGVFRAVKAGNAVVAGDDHLSPLTGAVQPGQERWGFLPKEFLNRYKRLRDQSPAISNRNPRDYFVDGAVSVYTKDLNGDARLKASEGDKVHIYLSMRRGGNFIYALDVSDPNTPKLMWQRSASSTGWGELGQTWSEPKVARLKANLYPDTNAATGVVDPNPDNVVLIFGAGYEKEIEDFNPCLLSESSASGVQYYPATNVVYTGAGTCTFSPVTALPKPRSKGRGILVVDAMSGNVIWQAGAAPAGAVNNMNLAVADMSYAIPSDVRLFDVNSDGFVDSIFVGDTGGNVWRVDLSDTDLRKWKVRKLAALSTGADTSIATKRKFMFAPDVVLGQDAGGFYFSVMLGSGDREHPFDTIVDNRFYMIKDRGEADTYGSGTGARSWSIADGATNAPTGAYGQGKIVLDADVTDATTTPAANQSGWKYVFTLGEKTVSAALTVSGTTFFSTNQPGAVAGLAACSSNLGVARIYQLAFADAGPTTDDAGNVLERSTVRQGGGYIPSPVFAAIQIGSGTSSSSSTPASGTSTGGCVGAACSSNAGGTPDTIVTPTGVVCFGPFCFSTGKLDVGSRRRAYWYKEID